MLLSSSVTVAVFLTGSTFVGASRWHIPPQRDVFIREYPSNSSTNVSLWAPYYRNVSAGAAWVIPQSTFDLGARAMSCECFNPDQNCCIAKSPSVAPFCVAQNASCCSNTFCNLGETCCGNACCAAGTKCSSNLSAPGCCPEGQKCSNQAICYDHSFINCSNTFFPLPQCCPASVPYCRNFKPHGIGCYAFSELPETTSIKSSSHAIAEPSSTSGLKPTTTITGTTTLLETITVQVVGSNELSLDFPTFTLPSNRAQLSISTKFVFSFPPTLFTPHIKSSSSSTLLVSPSTSSTSPLSLNSTSTSTSLISHSATSISTPSSASPTLCFNSDSQAVLPCHPSTTTDTASAANTSEDVPYPGAVVLHSSSTQVQLPMIFRPIASIKPWHIRLLYSLAISYGTLITLHSACPPNILYHFYVLLFTAGSLWMEYLTLSTMREFRLLDEDPDIQEERHNPFANIYQPHYIRHPEHGEVFYYEPIFYYSTVIEIARQSALVALNLFRGFVADKPSEDDIFYFLACPVLIYFFAMEWIMRRWTDGFEKDIREKARAAADRDAQKPVQEEEETAGADGAGKEESADQEAEKPFAQNEQTTSADNALGEEEGAAPTSILRFRESKGTVA